MSLVELLGSGLKSDRVVDLLEQWGIEVTYEFDRLHEATADLYYAASREGGFQLQFDEHQSLVTIFLYVAEIEGFTPVDLSAHGLAELTVPEAVRRLAKDAAVPLDEGTASFLGERRHWLRLEWPDHSAHYEFRQGALALVTLE